MRPAQKSNRARGRGNRKNGGGGGGGNNINRVYESAGPEGKVRGTPQQIVDKYLSLARDAQTSGDRVTAENFLQHAEHYQRLLLTAMGAQESRRESQPDDDDDDAHQGEGGRQNGNAPSHGGDGEGDGRSEARTGDQPGAHGDDADGSDEGGSGAQRGEGRRSRRGRNRQIGEHAEAGEDAAANGNGAAHAGNGKGAAADAEGANIPGFDTIDTDQSRGPDLLVETEEIAKSQPRRRRPRRDVSADGETAATADDATASETGEA